eukprot:COSAG01_NODE_5542_length_4195_cov_59.713135_3_plen_35_part_00
MTSRSSRQHNIVMQVCVILMHFLLDGGYLVPRPG